MGLPRRRWIAGLFCLATWTPAASAQQSATLNRFSASALPTDDFQVDRPSAPGHGIFGAVLHLDSGHSPLVFRGSEGEGPEQEVRVVSHQLMANAGLSIGLFDRLAIFAGLPVTLWMDGEEDPTIGSTPLAAHDGAGLGDAYIGVRARLLGGPDDLAALAIQATLSAPTAGDDQRFRGEEGVSLVPEALVSVRPGLGSRITANLGARVRGQVRDAASNLAFGNEFNYAVGFALPVWRPEPQAHLDLHAQAFGSTTFEDLEGTPLEAVGGAKLFTPGGLIFGAAAGAGITRGLGSPIVRGILMLGYQVPTDSDRDRDGLRDDADRCPDEPEDRDGFEDGDGCPDPDNDQDGIPDAADRCPSAAETQNGLEDDDGCPDEWGDRDQDGLLDDADRCPDEPEDVDSFEDEDGCPDPDNDRDGVPDTRDACPLEKGSDEERGCPIRDRDGDTVPDAIDNCPDEPGAVDNRGCVVQQKVQIEEGGLQILEKVYFETGKAVIQQRSFDLLDNVASVLSAHPELDHIVVEGHTDARGARAFNLELSRARAHSVVAYLIQRGVDAERLQARGHGPDRPRISPARSAADHAANRRVEFVIPAAQPAPSGPAGGHGGAETDTN